MGQAFHWFDEDKILTFCKDLLKENGCLAIVGYKKQHFPIDHPLYHIFEDFIQTINPFFEFDVDNVDNAYHKTHDKMKKYFNICEVKYFTEKSEIPITKLFDFLKSWSGYYKLLKTHSTDANFIDPIEAFRIECREVLNYKEENENEMMIEFTNFYYLLILKN